MKTLRSIVILSLILLANWTVFPSLLRAQTTEELIASLHSPLVKTRREAAEKLGARRDRAAVDPLIEVLKTDADEQVRQTAARSLGLLKVESAIPRLMEAFEDQSGLVREAVILALVNYYTEHNVDFITARREGIQWFNPFLETYEETAIEPFTEVDPRIIDGLVQVATQDRDRHVKVAAIRALGVLRATSSIDRLGDLMYSNSFLRVEILRTFIKLEHPLSAAYIIPFLNDDNRDVRQEALTAVGFLRSEAAVPRLIEVYQSGREARTKFLALQSLALIGHRDAEEIFLANLRVGEPNSRRFAYEGIARIENTDHAERVSRDRLQERNDVVKLAQAFTLYKLGRQEYVEAIIQELETRRRQQAYAYLLETHPEDLYPYLNRATLRSRNWIVQALGRTGTEESMSKLEPLQKSSDPELVRAATLAIERIKRRVEQGSRLQRTRPRRATP